MLTHRGYSTLYVLVGGLAVIGLFDVVLQYLRTYALSHTTNRITSNLAATSFIICCDFRSPTRNSISRPDSRTGA